MLSETGQDNSQAKGLAKEYVRKIEASQAAMSQKGAKPDITNIPFIGPILGTALEKLQIIATMWEGPSPQRTPLEIPFKIARESDKAGAAAFIDQKVDLGMKSDFEPLTTSTAMPGTPAPPSDNAQP